MTASDRTLARQPTGTIAFMQRTSNEQRPIGRVAIVSDSLPDRNGVGAYYRDLLDQLEDRGFKATLLSPSAERRAILQFPLPGDATQRIWVPSAWRFRRVLRTLLPEHIIVATPGPYGLMGAWWAKRLKARLIVGFHTHYSGVTDDYNNRFLRAFSRFYFEFADRILFRHADLVLANSESMVELAKSLGAIDSQVMGTLLPRDSLRPAVTPMRPKLERVVFAGRLAPEKKVLDVIDAARELPGIHFTIAGDGPLRKSVIRQASELDNVHYAGWVSRRDLLAEVDRADVLVLPSVVESFGTVAFEAMSRERLTLVSRNCGIVDWPDLAKHLYCIAEDQSIADALRTIAAIPSEQRAATAKSARIAALQLNERSLQHWLEVLQPAGTGAVASAV